MINFPCAKINLGLNIIERRPDGYHNLQTVFFPIPIKDALEIHKMDDNFTSATACDLKVTGNSVCCNETDNLITKAYNLLATDYKLPRIHAHLYKYIPSEAGLGGGSSDAAFMLRLLNDFSELHLTQSQMETYAAKLGADCAFFINASPCYAEGIGERLSPIEISENNLKGYTLVVVKPNVAVSTKEAFAHIKPKMPKTCCKEIVARPVTEWKGLLVNDFESSVFAQYPALADIKERLYSLGALYAQMSGSGSSFFALFKHDLEDECISAEFSDCRNFKIHL